MIAFIGSVFSPYYAMARARAYRFAARHGIAGPPGGADPRAAADAADHCAVNVALYGPAADRWAMTERGRGRLQVSTDHLAIGPSLLRWHGDALEITIDEVATPLPRRLRGTVRIHPDALQPRSFALDAGGRHRWRPIAPTAAVEVAFDQPALRWRGHGYLDTNRGDTALESDFVRWDWCRGTSSDPRSALVFYDVEGRDGPRSLALRIASDGRTEPVTAPPRIALPPTRWRLERHVPSDAGHPATELARLEDTPFYARTRLAGRWLGEPVAVVHESLSLQRFATRWVRCLLPFRKPRRAG